MLITIITVTYNAKVYIRKTIESVIYQSFSNIEYIIIDGKSTDGTIDVIEEYCEKYPIKWVSEKDNGIYDAMNKGIAKANGDYIQFLNAGDFLANEYTIENVVTSLSKNKCHILYGNIRYNYLNGEKRIRRYGSNCSKPIYYLTGDCINHQAIFAAKECFEKYQFDINYTICADREWMIRLCKEKYVFKASDILICDYLEGGYSDLHKKTADKEAMVCVKKHYPKASFVLVLLNICRRNKFLGKLLHKTYELLYIRKQRQK